jgi:hypothetical protein
MDIDDFIQKQQEFFDRVRLARETPHECEWDYRFIPDIGNGAFFETCKICLETKGLIELN